MDVGDGREMAQSPDRFPFYSFGLPLLCAGVFHMEMTEDQIVKIAKALSTKTRVRIVRVIIRKKSITRHDAEIVDHLSQPTISHHLKVLFEAGILEAQRDRRFGIVTVYKEALKAVGDLILRDLKD